MHITESEKEAMYKVIFSRRDVRSDFLPDTIPEEVVSRILLAGHHAPSVGFMQPWDFILVTEDDTRRAIKAGFDSANLESANKFEGERKEQYLKLKLEGIMEAPLGICVTCDRQRNGPNVLGRTIKPEMDLYSTVCAVQNMWLAARAENIGMGWVSIIHDEVLRKALHIPENKDIIAYLCFGYVSQFKEKPELETYGWLKRENISDLVHREKYKEKRPIISENGGLENSGPV